MKKKKLSDNRIDIGIKKHKIKKSIIFFLKSYAMIWHCVVIFISAMRVNFYDKAIIIAHFIS